MSVEFVLIGASLIVAGAFLFAFIWAVQAGQYDDTYTPSIRILPEDTFIPKHNREDKNEHGEIVNGT